MKNAWASYQVVKSASPGPGAEGIVGAEVAALRPVIRRRAADIACARLRCPQAEPLLHRRRLGGLERILVLIGKLIGVLVRDALRDPRLVVERAIRKPD